MNEVTMDCQSCNTKTDYRFFTNCEQCGCNLEPAGISQPAPILPDLPVEKRLSWKRRLVNLVYVLVSSIAGMISGAVALYFGFALVCITVLNHIDFQENPSAACARGTAMTALSILIGAFLGTMGGTAFAIKKPLCKAPTN